MPPQPCPSCCCAAGVCCRKTGGREKALAKMMRDHAAKTDPTAFAGDGDMYDSLAAAIFEHLDVVPAGVGTAIAQGYEKFFNEMHEKKAKGVSEE